MLTSDNILLEKNPSFGSNTRAIRSVNILMMMQDRPVEYLMGTVYRTFTVRNDWLTLDN